MSTLANITSLNLSLQTGGAALAVNAVKSVAKPERVVYVFGTADDVAPNFTTVAGAITYAQSFERDETLRVVVKMFTDTDGTPYDLTGFDSWSSYASEAIIFTSDFVRLNETTTLPSMLLSGLTVWYIDPNGVETLWVGREDGSAWPAVGYKEYVALLSQTGTNAPVATVLSNTLGSVAWSYEGVGLYYGTSSLITATQTFVSFSSTASNSDSRLGDESGPIQFGPRTGYVLVSTSDVGLNSSDDALLNYITIRVYP